MSGSRKDIHSSLESNSSSGTVVCAPIPESEDSLIAMPIDEFEKCFAEAVANATLDNYPTIEAYIKEAFRRGKDWVDFLTHIFGYNLEKISEAFRAKIPEPLASQIPFDGFDEIAEADKTAEGAAVADGLEIHRKVVTLFDSHPLSTLSKIQIDRLKEVVNLPIDSGATDSTTARVSRLPSLEKAPPIKRLTPKEKKQFIRDTLARTKPIATGAGPDALFAAKAIDAPITSGSGSGLASTISAMTNDRGKRSRPMMEASSKIASSVEEARPQATPIGVTLTAEPKRVMVRTPSGNVKPTRSLSDDAKISSTPFTEIDVATAAGISAEAPSAKRKRPNSTEPSTSPHP